MRHVAAVGERCVHGATVAPIRRQLAYLLRVHYDLGLRYITHMVRLRRHSIVLCLLVAREVGGRVVEDSLWHAMRIIHGHVCRQLLLLWLGLLVLIALVTSGRVASLL